MLALIPLLPFAGFVVNATLGRRLPKSVSGGLASLVMLASFVISVMSVLRVAGMRVEERAIQEVLYTWIASGDLKIDVRTRCRPACTSRGRPTLIDSSFISCSIGEADRSIRLAMTVRRVPRHGAGSILSIAPAGSSVST